MGTAKFPGATATSLCPVRLRFDPNVRVRGNQTFVGFEDVLQGQVAAVGQTVHIVETESGLTGAAIVTDIDHDKRVMYLSVDWSNLSSAGERLMTRCYSCGSDVPPDGPMPTFCKPACRDDWWGVQHDPVTDAEQSGSRAVVNGVIDRTPADRPWAWAVGAR